MFMFMLGFILILATIIYCTHSIYKFDNADTYLWALETSINNGQIEIVLDKNNDVHVRNISKHQEIIVKPRKGF